MSESRRRAAAGNAPAVMRVADLSTCCEGSHAPSMHPLPAVEAEQNRRSAATCDAPTVMRVADLSKWCEHLTSKAAL